MRRLRVGMFGFILVLLGTTLLPGCAPPQLSPQPVQTPGGSIALVIDLQAGFSGDTVLIHVNGQEVYRAQDIRTDYAIGLADSVELQVPQGAIAVEVAIPSRDLSAAIDLEGSAPLYLGVSIVDDKIDYQLSDERFLYY